MKTAFKKGIVAVIVLLSLAGTIYAQGIGQWFNQNQTQNKYLLQQIAALQVYQGYLKKGYAIAKDGTGTISDIRNNDLGLHAGHFDSLKTVSGKVRNYSKIKATIHLQQLIVSGHDKTAQTLASGNALTSGDLNGYNNICKAILQQSGNELQELQLVITNGKLQMSDDERLTRIDKCYAVMQHLYGQMQQINVQILSLAAQRARGRKDRQMLRSLYGQ